YLLEELAEYGAMELPALQELLKKAQISYEESLRAEKERTQLERHFAELQSELSKKQVKAEELEQEWQKAHSAHNKAIATLEERERQIPPELQEPAALENALKTAQGHQQKLKEELENAEQAAQKAENEQVRIKSQLEQIQKN